MRHSATLWGIALALLIALMSVLIYWPTLLVNTQKIQSIDPDSPYSFDGKMLHYQGKSIELGPQCFLVDANISAWADALLPYVYKDVKKALKSLSSGTEDQPSMLYIAPNVYWIDNPDDEEIRRPVQGGIPYGMMLDQEWIYLYGLSENPENVVLACNRGQTQGAEGNFTMFHFSGDGIQCENITMGNYCNVDLVYPLDESKNREKRMEAITQAQLVICQSDKVVARNCSFISRLNSCPFVGAKRALFIDCHFECTDDALCGHGVYLNCDLDFYSSKPFWSTHGTGAAFMNCDFNILGENVQYLTKVGSPVALIDCRFHHENNDLILEWTKYPKPSLRCYQSNLSLNGQQVLFHAGKPEHTVSLENKEALQAYCFEYKGEKHYNIYSLVRQNDDWDPLRQRDLVEEAERVLQCNLSKQATMLKLKSKQTSLESGVDQAFIQAEAYRFYDVAVEENVRWIVKEDDKKFIRCKQEKGGLWVDACNRTEQRRHCLIQAESKSGLQAAIQLEIKPEKLPAPKFSQLPALRFSQEGKLQVDYRLHNPGRADHSAITWYRCSDAQGKDAIPVAVSRMDKPAYFYNLSKADIGYYLMAEVAPKNIRSDYGNSQKAITTSPIQASQVSENYAISTDFRNFPCQYQPLVKEGFWTVDTYKPADTKDYDWATQTSKTWYYGSSQDGAVGYGLLQDGKGARLLYTPVADKYGDMSISLWVDPCKTAGQGFGSATGQYMDIFIKYDTKTLSGYGLRIIRTTKYANAVDFILMQYKNGESKEISPAVSAICYRTNCFIDIKVQGNTLTADVHSTTPLNDHPAGLPKEVHLQTSIENNHFGGMGIQHTGSTGSSATMLHELHVSWH